VQIHDICHVRLSAEHAGLLLLEQYVLAAYLLGGERRVRPLPNAFVSADEELSQVLDRSGAARVSRRWNAGAAPSGWRM
jgi:hypothetical protein